MSSRQQRIQILYEISLAIDPGETLTDTVTTALSAYLQKLNCSVGGVFQQTNRGYELIASRPAAADTDALFAAGSERLSTWVDTDPAERTSFPLQGAVNQTGEYYLFKLPEFGVLLLGQRGDGLDQSIIRSLVPLNEKLATACQAVDVQTQLREERNRFQAVFTTIQEPVVNVSVDGDSAVIHRANDAFVDTFGHPTTGETSQIEPTQPPNESGDIADRLVSGEAVTEEVRRETTRGAGDFLLRAVPVSINDVNEYFLMYIDITAEKRRQRKLEDFYREIETLFRCDDRAAVCEQTISTATTITSGTIAEIHLYDRAADALYPAASTAETSVFPSSETVLWETYSNEQTQSLEDATAIPTADVDIESAVAAPLGDHGVMVIGSDQSGAFTDTDFQFIRLLAALSVVAHNRAQRTESLETIQELTQEAVTSESREEMADPVLDQLPEALNLPLTGIWEYNSAQNRLEPIGMTDAAKELLGAHPKFEEGEGIAWETFDTGETRLIGDVGDHPEVYNDESPINSEVIAPLGEFGLLMAGSVQSQNFSEVDRNIVETLASSLETAIELVDNRQELTLLDQVIGRVLRHNVRNDLNVIKGYATALREDASGETPFLDEIIENCASVERTADTARTMQEVVQTRDMRQKTDVGIAINDAVDQLHDRAPKADVRIDMATGGTVVAHPKLPAAIHHLLANSLEHAVNDPTTPADHIRVQTERVDGEIVIEVADDGDGIPQHELDVLTTHGESALEHGSGVGLWLIDRIIEYSNGSIEFETNSGTTVQIYLEPAE